MISRDMVRLGEHNKETTDDCEGKGQSLRCAPPPQDIRVQRTHVHKDYSPRDRSQRNDIALLRLQKSAELNCKFLVLVLTIIHNIINIYAKRMKINFLIFHRRNEKKLASSLVEPYVLQAVESITSIIGVKNSVPEDI